MVSPPTAQGATDEFAFVPSAVEDCYRGTYDGFDIAERTMVCEEFAAAIDHCFNPQDGDGTQETQLINAMLNAASYLASLACTCTPGDDDGPCGRCAALGRWHDERRDR